jgi:hypothetical protein
MEFLLLCLGLVLFVILKVMPKIRHLKERLRDLETDYVSLNTKLLPGTNNVDNAYNDEILDQISSIYIEIERTKLNLSWFNLVWRY